MQGIITPNRTFTVVTQVSCRLAYIYQIQIEYDAVIFDIKIRYTCVTLRVFIFFKQEPTLLHQINEQNANVILQQNLWVAKLTVVCAIYLLFYIIASG